MIYTSSSWCNLAPIHCKILQVVVQNNTLHSLTKSHRFTRIDYHAIAKIRTIRDNIRDLNYQYYTKLKNNPPSNKNTRHQAQKDDTQLCVPWGYDSKGSEEV